MPTGFRDYTKLIQSVTWNVLRLAVITETFMNVSAGAQSGAFQNIYDDDPGSYYMRKVSGTYSGNVTDFYYLTFQLPKTYKFVNITSRIGYYNEDYSGIDVYAAIDVSTDGSTWTTLTSKYFTSSQPEQLWLVSYGSFIAKYIRVRIYSHDHKGVSRYKIYEITPNIT